MAKRALGSLGAMVRKKRGDGKLRAVAKEIGIGPATLMRVEGGRIPDVTTFGKICNWLKIDPGSFLGFEPAAPDESPIPQNSLAPLTVGAHLKADRTPKQETVHALAQMILFAASSQRGTEDISGDGDDA
jgi:transcriptional regulator with XRE-family HTH domain